MSTLTPSTDSNIWLVTSTDGWGFGGSESPTSYETGAKPKSLAQEGQPIVVNGITFRNPS
jgi:hypothetical protein